MVKSLNGAELAGFIKERQAKQVRALRQSWKVFPRLVIFTTTDNPVTEKYINLKKSYAEDILIDVDILRCGENELVDKIKEVNQSSDIHGIIVQLPLSDTSKTDQILVNIDLEKDVDNLSGKADFIPATALAIQWLLAGYGIEPSLKRVAIVGNGRLVGAPYAKVLRSSGIEPTIFEEGDDLSELINYSLVITATGKPGLIKSDMLQNSATVVDAGVADEAGTLKGDVSDEVRENRRDVSITPIIGGVGPLTVAALIDNVIAAARKVADQKGQQDI